MALTIKQQLFVDAYVTNGFNATQAAISAGYSAKTAYSQGQRLLKHVEVAAEISRRLEAKVMGRDEALEAMSDMARSDIDDFLTVPGAFPYIDLAKARQLGKMHLIKKIKVRGDGGMEIELYDRLTAIRNIGLHHGLWKDGIEIKVDVNLIVQVVDALESAGLDAQTVFNDLIDEARKRHADRLAGAR